MISKATWHLNARVAVVTAIAALALAPSAYAGSEGIFAGTLNPQLGYATPDSQWFAGTVGWTSDHTLCPGLQYGGGYFWGSPARLGTCASGENNGFYFGASGWWHGAVWDRNSVTYDDVSTSWWSFS